MQCSFMVALTIRSLLFQGQTVHQRNQWLSRGDTISSYDYIFPLKKNLESNFNSCNFI